MDVVSASKHRPCACLLMPMHLVALRLMVPRAGNSAQHDPTLSPLSSRLVQEGLEAKLHALLQANMQAGMAGQQPAAQQQPLQAQGSAALVMMRRMDGVVAEFGATAARVSQQSCRCTHAIPHRAVRMDAHRDSMMQETRKCPGSGACQPGLLTIWRGWVGG